MTVPILTLPNSAFTRSQFGLKSNTQVFKSPLTGTTQTLERPGARWVAEYALPPMKRAQFSEWQSFLTQLRGGAGRFYGYDPDAKTARGSILMSSTSSTNYIANGDAVGARAGIENAGGLLPTGWVWGLANGLTREIISSGTQNGVPFVEIRFYGTPTNTTVAVNFTSSKSIPASSGEDWTSSVAYKMTSGSLSNIIGVYQRIEQVQITGPTANMNAKELFSLDNTWRYSHHSKTLTVTSPATGFVRNSVYLSLTIGQPVDITLAIGRVHLERNSTNTVYIPTSGQQRSRSAGARIDGGLQIGGTLKTWNWQANAVNVLLKGDYIAIDTPNGRSLHMVVNNTSADNDGCAAIAIEPPLRASPLDNTQIIVTNPSCVMALVEDSIQWHADETGTYRLSFAAEERF